VPISAAISVPCIVVALNVELFSRSKAKFEKLMKKASPDKNKVFDIEESKRADLETGLRDDVATTRLAKIQTYKGQPSLRTPYKSNP
jgi:hypothetical protein